MTQKEIRQYLQNLRTSKKHLNLTREDFELGSEHGALREDCNDAFKAINRGTEYLKVLDPTEPIEPPEPEYTYTKYPLFGEGAVNFVSGMNPWDSHAINLPFWKDFTREQWSEGCELLSQYGVNFVRFFMATGENREDIATMIYPFKKLGAHKVDLFDYDHEDMVEYEWRLNELWKRGITTMLCLCTGIKGFRFEHCVWHGDRNRGYPERQKDGSIVWQKLTTNCDDFMRDGVSRKAVRMVGKNLYRRWADKPVVIETINEADAFGFEEGYAWNFFVLGGLRGAKCPGNKMAFGWMDSGRSHDLLSEFKCRTFPHGVNAMDWFRRFQKPSCELQRDYFDVFPLMGVDADGYIPNSPEFANYDFTGRGLVGWLWNKKFIRACPTHMRDGLVYMYDHNGGGWIIWSAGAWYDHNSSGRPNYNDWYHVAVKGLSPAECKIWGREYNDFSYIPKGTTQRIPLGELVAVKLAMERIFA